MGNVSITPDIVRLLRDGFGVEDIALKVGVNPRFVRSHIEAMRKTGALYDMYKQARKERAAS